MNNRIKIKIKAYNNYTPQNDLKAVNVYEQISHDQHRLLLMLCDHAAQ